MDDSGSIVLRGTVEVEPRPDYSANISVSVLGFPAELTSGESSKLLFLNCERNQGIWFGFVSGRGSCVFTVTRQAER